VHLAAPAAETSGGVNLELADGWEVLASSSTRIVAAKGNGVIMVDITQPPADPGAMIQSNLQGLLDRGMQNLQVTNPEPAALPSSNFVAAQRMNLRGVLASQQGGSVAVEGFAFYLVRQDGVGITVTGVFDEGELERTPSLVKEYGAMLNSILSGS
jgi:hypothetical protein